MLTRDLRSSSTPSTAASAAGQGAEHHSATESSPAESSKTLSRHSVIWKSLFADDGQTCPVTSASGKQFLSSPSADCSNDIRTHGEANLDLNTSRFEDDRRGLNHAQSPGSRVESDFSKDVSSPTDLNDAFQFTSWDEGVFGFENYDFLLYGMGVLDFTNPGF